MGVSKYGPSCITAVPIGHQGPVSWKTIFPLIGGGREGFGMIQVRYTYCTLYFYHYYISFTSDHQTLDPGGWIRQNRGPESRKNLTEIRQLVAGPVLKYIPLRFRQAIHSGKSG